MDTQTITEGQATIRYQKSANGNESVFYNPVQAVNRDLSLAVIKQFHTVWEKELTEKKKKRPEHEDGKLTIFEALSATGLRSIRYAAELGSAVKRIIANDRDPVAVEAIRQNVAENKVSDVVVPNEGDASIAMHISRGKGEAWHVVDLDPYGSAAPFLDAAVQSVCDGGLLCVTCTDSTVLCGNFPEVCYSRYGALPMKGDSCHEMGLRMILGSMEAHAVRYKRHIVPLLSLKIDFYFRVFVRVFDSAAQAKFAPTKMVNVHHCIGCATYYLQRLAKTNLNANGTVKNFVPAMAAVPVECQECGGHLRLAGPIWGEAVHDQTFVRDIQKMLLSSPCPLPLANTAKRVLPLLRSACEELPDAVLHHTLRGMCNTLHCTTPPMPKFRAAVIQQGYQISRAHSNAQAIKSTAPPEVLWDILKCWATANPTKRSKNPNPKSPAYAMLQKKPAFQVDFDALDGDSDRIDGQARFPQNPRPHWGPKSRAKHGPEASSADAPPNVGSSSNQSGVAAEAVEPTSPKPPAEKRARTE